MNHNHEFLSCSDKMLILYKNYKEAPHLTFEGDKHLLLTWCLSSYGHMHYHENRKAYLHKVRTINYNDYICKEFQQKQMDLLWKEADLYTKTRMWLS